MAAGTIQTCSAKSYHVKLTLVRKYGEGQSQRMIKMYAMEFWKTECFLLASANRADPIFTDIKIESACSNGDQS